MQYSANAVSSSCLFTIWKQKPHLPHELAIQCDCMQTSKTTRNNALRVLLFGSCGNGREEEHITLSDCEFTVAVKTGRLIAILSNFGLTGF